MERQGMRDPYSEDVKGFWTRRIGKYLRHRFGPQKEKYFTILFFILTTVLIITSLIVSFLADLKTAFPANVSQINKEKVIPTIEMTPVPTLVKKTQMSDLKGANNVDNPCLGVAFEIMQQLDDVWGNERPPLVINQEDPDIISASGSANFQVTKKYPYSCRTPWIAKISFTPLKEQSVGVFFEFEDVFRVLVGDGDRITWKVEENSGNRKDPWVVKAREKLQNGKISLDKEMSLILEVKPVQDNLELKITFSYIPEDGDLRISEPRIVRVQAKGIDLVNFPARHFRVGLNDYRYKGNGSEIKFGVFSVKEL